MEYVYASNPEHVYTSTPKYVYTSSGFKSTNNLTVYENGGSSTDHKKSKLSTTCCAS